MNDKKSNLRPEKKVEHYVWSFQAHLGSGAFGKVYLGKDEKTNEPVAIKVLKLAMLHADDYLFKALSNEIDIMKKLNAPNIVKHLNVYFTKHNVYIIQEYCEGGDLRGYLTSRKGPLPEKQAKKILADVVNGFKELQKQDVSNYCLKGFGLYWRYNE
jgi:serine/threonine protein kinase